MDASSRRIGGLSALALGLLYLVVIVVFVIAGAVPDDAAERLRYLADHTAAWWLIVALNVVTDLLYVPVLWALYKMLKGVNRDAMLAGSGLVGLFVVVDLAVTWPNYSALINLGNEFVGARDEAQRAVVLGAAKYGVEVLSSGFFGFYALLLPAVGIAVIGLVMLAGGFGRVAAYLAIAIGVFGVLSVAGPLVVDAAAPLAIVTSLLTTVWVLLVGYKLLRPAR